MVGARLGDWEVGLRVVGDSEGLAVGDFSGESVGLAIGEFVGKAVGPKVGAVDGFAVGEVGELEGVEVGKEVGVVVGPSVGDADGFVDGEVEVVGEMEGLGVGAESLTLLRADAMMAGGMHAAKKARETAASFIVEEMSKMQMMRTAMQHLQVNFA